MKRRPIASLMRKKTFPLAFWASSSTDVLFSLMKDSCLTPFPHLFFLESYLSRIYVYAVMMMLIILINARLIYTLDVFYRKIKSFIFFLPFGTADIVRKSTCIIEVTRKVFFFIIIIILPGETLKTIECGRGAIDRNPWTTPERKRDVLKHVYIKEWCME